MENWILAEAIALYYYNVSGFEWARTFQARLSRTWHPEYVAEQERNFCRGFSSHFGTLDFGNQQTLVAVILERYGEEATDKWTLLQAMTERGDVL